MHLQAHFASKHTLCAANFPNSTNSLALFPPNQCQKLVQNPYAKPGFCNSAKRVSRLVGGKRWGLVGLRCEGRVECDDGFYMRRCVELARRAVGRTSPNPMVGCVIVKDGKIVGEGFHPKAGQPHAEVFALRDAGDLAENSTAYVTLEPCNHYGRTPPCTEALIKAKVKRAVIGMVDPNPIVASKGVDRLRDAGIHVTVGVEEELCKKLNEAYIHQMLTGKPFITLSFSLSIDGYTLDEIGEKEMESGGYYSQMLEQYDAVLISLSSLRNKFSFPESKEPGANQPLQIVVARNLSTPIQIPVLNNEATSKVIIFTEKEIPLEPDIVKMGVETVVLDGLNLTTILEYCKRRGLCSVLLDIRGSNGDLEEIIKEGFEENLLQKVVVEVLPTWKGCKKEKFPLASTILEKSLRLKILTSRNLSGSSLLEGYF
ncbi:Diaminohydroxyphosphoribosylaminopyrimidine deaminase [Bertholletia excelsa]